MHFSLKALALLAILAPLNSAQELPYCVRPSERARCQAGAIGNGTTCDSLVCYNQDLLCDNEPSEKDQFEAGCYLLEGFTFLQTCIGLFAPAESRRENPVDCYNGHGITITEPARGRCEAGGCCTPDPSLCDFERQMHFMSVGYGVATDLEADGCNSAFDYFGENPGCTYLTDGNSNEALLCNNIGAVTSAEEAQGDLKFCHVSFAGTNDINDVLAYAKQIFDPLGRREVTYGDVSFTVIEALASIALGSEDDESDGIVEIVLNEAEKMGCFNSTGAAFGIYGHSLGGAKADILALMIGGFYPDVHVELTTLDQPALLVEPLEGAAASLKVWDRKTQYIAGVVMPRGPIFMDFYSREYGPYQDYDFVSQVFPGVFYANSTQTKVQFLCEVLSEDESELTYFLSDGWGGCAQGRTDVLNEMPTFPHPGGLERNDESNFDENLKATLFYLEHFLGVQVDDDIVEALNAIATLADINLRESFWLVLDLHMMRRGLHFSHVLTGNGMECARMNHTIEL